MSGEDDPATLLSLDLHVEVLKALGRPATETKPFFAALFAGNLKTRGADHPATVRTIHNEAHALAEQGRFAEAEALARGALDRAVASPQLGRASAAVRSIAKLEVRCLAALNRPDEAAAIRDGYQIEATATTTSAATTTTATTTKAAN